MAVLDKLFYKWEKDFFEAETEEEKKKIVGKIRERYFVTGVPRPDLDNYEKAVMDAANGVLYKDDSQIVSKNTRKIYGEVPKVIIKIEENEL